jgi:hypothetical protein
MLCFSASLNGRLKIKSKDEGLKTKEKPFFVIPTSFLPESILLSLLIILDTGLRRHDEGKYEVLVLAFLASPIRF